MQDITACFISAADSIEIKSSEVGSDKAPGPLIRVTFAPASCAAVAIAYPIFPELRLPIKRTGSIASKVGPAVTIIFKPCSSPEIKHCCRADKISATSNMRPSPVSPQACKPLLGPN